jgi:hypothetical protein
MCVVCSLASFVLLGLRDFFAMVARRGVWRFPIFLIAADAPDFGAG